MKYFFSLIILLLCATAGHSQRIADSSCKQYHKGKFTYVDSLGYTINVIRKKHYQNEFNNEEGTWIELRIKWISDCEYELYQVTSNSKSERKFNRSVTVVTITKTLGSDGYEYSAKCKCPDGPALTGTMRRVYN